MAMLWVVKLHIVPFTPAANPVLREPLLGEHTADVLDERDGAQRGEQAVIAARRYCGVMPMLLMIRPISRHPCACARRALPASRRDLDRDVVHALLHLGQEQRAGDLGIELRHDVLRHPGGPKAPYHTVIS